MKDKDSAQFRHEEGDGHGSVKGTYGYTDDKGHYREVQYVADKNGFRAKVNTNEPGTANQDPAHVDVKSSAKHYEDHFAGHAPSYHKHEIHPVHHIKHVPHYHKVEVAPQFHKVEVAPSHKHWNNYKSNFNNYNFDNFSPIDGYSYKPFSFSKQTPFSGYNNGFKYNLGKHTAGYNIQTPYNHNSFAFNGFGNNFEGGNSYSNDEIKKFIDEVKNHRHNDNIGGFGNSDNFDNIGSFGNIGKLQNAGSFGLNDFKNDNIEKIIDELKHKAGNDNYNSYGNFKDNNDFQIKEFRNIGDHKYSRSS